MSELKKPTIEGLIEKLLEKNHIKENEARDVQESLEQASNGMSKDEIFTLVTTLNDKLEATTGDLITPNGLNYAIFDNIVKTVSQEIKKEKVQKEKSEFLENEKRLQETNIDEKKLKEEQEKINKSMETIKDMFSKIPGLDDFEFPQDALEIFGKAKNNFEEVLDRAEEIRRNNPQITAEDALEKASKEKGININDGENQIALATIVYEQVKKMQKQEGISEDEAFEKLSSEETVVGNMVKSEKVKAKQQGKKVTFVSFVKDKVLSGAEVFFYNKGQACDTDINALEKDGWYLNAKALKDKIAEKEEAERCFTYWRNIKNNKKDFDIDYTEFTKKYLSTELSISQIYEQFRKEDPNSELKFNDMLEGIVSCLEKFSDSPRANYTLESIRDVEKQKRVYEQVMNSINIAKRTSKLVGGLNDQENRMILDELKEIDKRDISTINEVKKAWIKITKIDIEKYQAEHENSVEENNNADIVNELENNRDRITRDRNQVIRLSKELGISTDEAAKKYFEENPQFLKQYSVKERKILLGKNQKENEEIEISKALKKLGSFIKIINNKIINISKVDRQALLEKIERIKNSKDISFPYELRQAMKNLERTEKKIKICENINARLNEGPKKKNASEVFDSKSSKEKEKEIFEEYLTSGKSATEILSELNKEENKYNIKDIIKIIANGSKKYLRKEELKKLIKSEKSIHEKTIELNAIEQNKKNAEEKGLTDWVTDFENKINDLNSDLEVNKNRTITYKERMRRRSKTTVDKTNNVDDKNQSSQKVSLPEDENKPQSTNGIETGNIKTDGKKHDIIAIAQKKNVTSSKIGKMFAKIKDLYNTQKKSKQEELENEIEEKNMQTSSEEIR